MGIAEYRCLIGSWSSDTELIAVRVGHLRQVPLFDATRQLDVDRRCRRLQVTLPPEMPPV